MNELSFSYLPSWAIGVSLAAHLVAGLGLGVVYFQTLWWNTRLFVGERRTKMAVALMLGRFVLLGGILILTTFEGAPPLLAMASGILIVRHVILRRLRDTSL